MPGNITSEAAVNSVAFLADGSLAGNCDDGKVRVWDPASGQVKRTLVREKGGAALLPGDLLAVGTAPAEAKIWDLATGSLWRRFGGPAQTAVRGAAVSSNRGVAALTTRPDRQVEDTVHIVDLEGRVKHSAPAGIGGTSAMAFSPDGSLLVAASYDTDLRAWNARNGELLVRVTALPLATFAVAFSPDGRWLAAGGADRQVHLFDTKTWKVARVLQGQNEMVSCLAFSPDGQRMLTGGFNDLTVKHPVQALLWNLASGAVVKRFDMPRRVNAVAFAPDGKLGAAAIAEKRVPLLGV